MIVLLNDACTCAMPSSTFLRDLLRLLRHTCCGGASGPCGRGGFSLLFVSHTFTPCPEERSASRPACAGPCACAHWCAYADHEPAGPCDGGGRGSAEVHETLDVHGILTAQVALDRGLGQRRADRVDLGLGEILHLGGGRDAAATQMAFARERPTPKMCVSPMTTCLFIGMLMPAIRAMFDTYSVSPGAACGAGPSRCSRPRHDGARSCSSCRSS